MAPNASNDKKKTLKNALELEQSGNPGGAAQLLWQLAKDAPTMPEAQFHLARMVLKSKTPQVALKPLKTARRLSPEVTAIWKLSARAILAFGTSADIGDFKTDLRNAPLSIQEKEALFQAITHINRGGFGGASKKEADAMIAALTAQDFHKAKDLATDLNNRFPNTGHILNALATAFAGLDDIELADSLFNRAVLLEPRAPSILINYCRFLTNRRQWVESSKYGEKANEIQPDEPRIQSLLANSYRHTHEYSKALNLANRSLSAGFESRENYITKAEATAELSGIDAGLAVITEFIERTGDTVSKGTRSNLLQSAGRFKEAIQDLLDVLKEVPEMGESYFQISMAHKFKVGDPILNQLEAAETNPNLGENAVVAVNFALAKAYDDTKQYEKVFSKLNKANGIMASRVRFDEGQYLMQVNRTKVFAKEADLMQLQDYSDNEFNPIFVSGIARSGTTLTEQIVSKHSKCVGVGEAFWSGRHFGPVLFDNEEVPPAEERILQAGRDYEQSARETEKSGSRIVDKALQNHQRLGFLAASMPKAKIIILKRDPRDNLLSIYKNKFGQNSLTFNTNMRALAFYYAEFLKYLDFWEEVLPGSFYTLEYDKLTSDPEAETRKLIDYCGLEWEDGVLDHGSNTKTIKTLSAFQARQPIYRSSVRSWEKYADDLKPMIDALKEFGVLLPD